MNIGTGKLYFIDDNGQEKELGIIDCGESIDIDYSDDKVNQMAKVEATNGEISLDLKLIARNVYHRKKKGRRYVYIYYEEVNLYDDFLEKVFKKKNKNKKIIKLGKKKCNC